MTITNPERVAGLTEHAASAMIAARSSLSQAAYTAEEVDQVLRRGESDIDELSAVAGKVRWAEDGPERHFRDAQAYADGIEQRLGQGRRGLEEVAGHLDQATVALNVGRQALLELEQGQDQRGGPTENLRQRIEGLGRAVGAAREGVNESAGRLDRAKENLQPLVFSSSYVEDRGRTAAAVKEAQSTVSKDVSTVRGDLAGLRDRFDATEHEVNRTAQQSVDLATTARAAMNPTPASGRWSSAGSAERDLRLRQGPATQGPGHER